MSAREMVVLEIYDDEAAVLDKNGTVHMIRNHEYEEGQILTVEVPEEADTEKKSAFAEGGKIISILNHAKRYTTHVAAVLAVVILTMFGGFTVYATPVSYVSLDSDVSLKYALNRFDRVVGVTAYSEETVDVMQQLDQELRGKKLADAVEMTLDALAKNNLVTEDGMEVLFTVSSEISHEDELTKNVTDIVNAWNKSQNDEKKPGISGTTVKVDDTYETKSKKEQISPGQLYLKEKESENTDEDTGAKENITSKPAEGCAVTEQKKETVSEESKETDGQTTGEEEPSSQGSKTTSATGTMTARANGTGNSSGGSSQGANHPSGTNGGSAVRPSGSQTQNGGTGNNSGTGNGTGTVTPATGNNGGTGNGTATPATGNNDGTMGGGQSGSGTGSGTTPGKVALSHWR